MGMLNLSAAMKEIAAREGISEQELASQLQMSYSDFRNGKDGKSKKQQEALIEKIKQRYPHLPKEWPSHEAPKLVLPVPMIPIPLVGGVEAGLQPVGQEDQVGLSVLIPQTMYIKDCTAWTVTGTSMMDWLMPGETVITRPRRDPKLGFAHRIKLNDGSRSVKVITFDKDKGEYVLRSVNRNYADEAVECVIEGLVVGIYSVDGSYQRIEFDPEGLRPRIF